MKTGCLIFVVVVVLAVWLGSTRSHQSGSTGAQTATTSAPVSEEATAQPDTPAPETPEPTEEPAPKPLTDAQLRAQFLEGVDESISGGKIAGNPFRYIGKSVDHHCTVSNIPDPTWFNAACGERSDGLPAIIVIEADTTDLQVGQSVRVMGVVDQPMDGTNAMGGSMQFPAVSSQFMQ